MMACFVIIIIIINETPGRPNMCPCVSSPVRVVKTFDILTVPCVGCYVLFLSTGNVLNLFVVDMKCQWLLICILRGGNSRLKICVHSLLMYFACLIKNWLCRSLFRLSVELLRESHSCSDILFHVTAHTFHLL